jgi:hypothetical protein
LQAKGVDEAVHYLVLELKDVAQLPIVTLRPDLITRGSVDQLNIDPDLVAGSACATLKQIFDTQIAPDGLYCFGPTLVSEA